MKKIKTNNEETEQRKNTMLHTTHLSLHGIGNFTCHFLFWSKKSKLKKKLCGGGKRCILFLSIMPFIKKGKKSLL